MADSLTRERDGLHEALAALARDKGLPGRGRTRSSGWSAVAAEEPEAPQAAGTPAGEKIPDEEPTGG